MAFRKVFEFKEITLVYASNGAATLQFFTDMPSGGNPPGTLAGRLTTPVTLPATTSDKRQTMTIPLDGIRGSQFYPAITPGSTTQFELYSAVCYARPLGVYIDGSAVNGGEIWQTVPLAPGVGGA